MAKAKQESCCGAGGQMVVLNNCQIVSLLTVDERGQMVLPKDVRQRAGIKPGDKFGLVTLDKGDETCCFILVKANKLAGQVKNIIGPIMMSEPDKTKRKGKG